MRTFWPGPLVLALCLSPALADAREGGRDRSDRGGRQTSSDRRDRAERRHARPRSRASSDRPARSFDRGRASRDDRGGSDRVRRSDRGRAWDGGRRSDGNRRYESRDHGRYEPRGRTRYFYRSAPRRGWPVFRYSLPRYPAYYRHGYIHLHGYYYPRYYYDHGAYYTHASIRLLVEPRETEVYVDGYYAGVVDDFDGIFQRLHVTPGPHDLTLRLPGLQTWSIEVYATPDRTINVHHDMIPGPGGAGYGDQPYEEPRSSEGYGYDGP
jgi:hypothetical protein